MERVPVGDSYAGHWHASLETRGPGFRERESLTRM